VNKVILFVQKNIHFCILIFGTNVNISEQLGNNEINVCINRIRDFSSTDNAIYFGFPDELFLYGRLRHWSPREVCLCKNSPRNARDVMSVHWVGKVLLKKLIYLCHKVRLQSTVSTRAFPSKLALYTDLFLVKWELRRRCMLI
jgi:hypothetical protein